MKTTMWALILAMALAGPALAAGGNGDNDVAQAMNPDYVSGRQAVKAKQWEKAIGFLTKVVAAEPKNADAFNYLGYAYRKSGDFSRAVANYKQALALDPKHRGAHEYIGEAYLEQGDLARAEHHLKRLDKLCFFGCEEYDDLKEAVAAFKQKGSS